MRDVLSEVQRWQAAGQRVALATVVKVWGSAPRPPGSKMAISSGGDMAGSVSGGCVEGAVFEESQTVLTSGKPKLLRFGVSDEVAWSVGLSCGGEIEILVERLEREEGAQYEVQRALTAALAAERLCALVTLLGGEAMGDQRLVFPDGEVVGSLGPELDRALDAERGASFERRASERIRLGGESGVEVFVEIHWPSPQLIVVGAVHSAIALVTFARALGYRTVVIDPRGAFATAERFAHADRLIREWPPEAFEGLRLTENTALVFLSHDLKLDLPGLKLALKSPAGYIGALGSKKTNTKRAAALAEEGFSAADIARIHAPVGLPLGGRRPEEIALSVMAEIVAVSHGQRLVPASPSS